MTDSIVPYTAITAQEARKIAQAGQAGSLNTDEIIRMVASAGDMRVVFDAPDVDIEGLRLRGFVVEQRGGITGISWEDKNGD